MVRPNSKRYVQTKGVVTWKVTHKKKLHSELAPLQKSSGIPNPISVYIYIPQIGTAPDCKARRSLRVARKFLCPPRSHVSTPLQRLCWLLVTFHFLEEKRFTNKREKALRKKTDRKEKEKVESVVHFRHRSS